MSVYSFTDYREYLAGELGKGKRNGQRQRLAEVVGCQSAHLSQVLNGKNHLSIEHAFGVSRFFSHTESEAEYFLNILQYSRAGTMEAKDFFRKKAVEIKARSLKIKDKITSEKRELSLAEQAIYYGDGAYALAHVASSLPSVKSTQDLARVLDVDVATANKIVQFLLSVGLVAKKGAELTTGPGHTHLSADSPHLKKHHLNLRLNALHKLDKGLRTTDIRYATYYTLSKADAFKIKEEILKLVDQNLKIVGPSKEEVLYCNIIDFFAIEA